MPIGGPALEAIRNCTGTTAVAPRGRTPVFLLGPKTTQARSAAILQLRLKKYLAMAGLDPP